MSNSSVNQMQADLFYSSNKQSEQIPSQRSMSNSMQNSMNHNTNDHKDQVNFNQRSIASSCTDSSMPLEQTINLRSLQKQVQNIEDKQSMVMSRTDWFSFLKIAYNQLAKLEQNSRRSDSDSKSDSELISLVIKDNFVKIIEFNLNKIPLKKVEDYLGSNLDSSCKKAGNQIRKEKYLSFDQVITCLKSLNTNEFDQVHWDDIIDSLMAQSQQISSRQIQSNTQGSSTALNEIESKYQESQRIKQLEDEIKGNITKIVLKDESILFDLSKVQGQLQNTKVDIIRLLKNLMNNSSLATVRAMSFSQLKLNNLKDFQEINAFQSLVILNLSSMDIDPNLLRNINFISLQYLNIANNQLKEINLISSNLSKLKELNVSHNRFITAKNFSKIENLKLLDLSFNQIDLYEEIICLAFTQSLVVLNLAGNPICYVIENKECPKFLETVKKLLPKIMIFNPPFISKVSCFENFKDLAFSIGRMDGQHSTSQSVQSEFNSSRVLQKQLNLQNYIPQIQPNKDNCQTRSNSVSRSATPEQTSSRQVSVRQIESRKSQSPQNYQYQQVHSPYDYPKIREVEQRASPFNLDNESIQLRSTPKNLISATDNFSNANILNTSNFDNASTYDSNIHKKLEDTHKIQIKNDHLKYFNPYNKNTDNSPLSECERRSISSQLTNILSPYDNMNPLQNSKKEERQKPPRYIRIKPTSYTGTDNSFTNVDTQNQNSSRTQIHENRMQIPVSAGGGNISIIQSLNNQTIITQASELHQNLLRSNQKHQIKRDMSVKLNSQNQYKNFDLIQHPVKRENSIQSMGNKGSNRFINDITVNDENSDMAHYYEQQISSMNIKKIREMPSKEIFKVANTSSSNIIDTSVSPIKAMMIAKPPDDQVRQSSKSLSRLGQGQGSNTNRTSLKNSERQSMLDHDRINQFTPQKFKNQRNFIRAGSQNKNSNSRVVGNSNHMRLITQSSEKVDRSLIMIQHNKTQNVQIKNLIMDNSYGKDLLGNLKSDQTFNQLQQIRSFQGIQNESKIKILPQISHHKKSSIRSQPQSEKELSSKRPYHHARISSYSPNHGQEDKVKSFKIAALEGVSPRTAKQASLAKINDFDQKLSNVTNSKRESQKFQPQIKTQEFQISKNGEYINTQQTKTSSDNGGNNTPRFSQRNNLQKEVRYQDAVEIINHKRKKVENKKNLYNSIAGKAQGKSSQNKSRQSSNSGLSNITNSQKVANQNSLNSQMSNQTKTSNSILKENHIGERQQQYKQTANFYNEGPSQCQQLSNGCFKLSIDLRQRR
ncbi:UNKNOWN [Stylonychia lemnae]|uniref:Leucine rich repeat family protein n=1 Tax=Stylonychia lemnae TaxID=5949 RepID=A0A077ZYJ4_STYLE|nr:UNKNOWN [Stylonychia lemnae]|eukprot:CDW74262.1 UNKNOWN [Stylonychia lemnae]